MVESTFHASGSASSPPKEEKRLSRPEAVRLLKTAVYGSSSAAGNSTDRSGNTTSRSGGGNTARSRRSGGSNTARGERMNELSQPGTISSSPGSPMALSDSVSLLQLRREYDEKLERERLAIKRRELELEEHARRVEKAAHRDAVNETTRGLTKLRLQQKRQLHAHHQMHKAAESEKMQAEARAVHLAAQQRDELAKTKALAKAEAEAKGALEMKSAEDRHEEQMARQAEQLNAAAERKLDEANELKRRETVRAEKLQQELDAAKAEIKNARLALERARKEKDEALREAATKALSEKNQAIQAEKDKAETARRTALQAEGVRGEVVNLRSKQADDITALATQALKVAEAEKAKADSTWRQAESERKAHAAAREEAELLRSEGRAQVEKAKKLMDEANEKVEKMSHAMTLQKAALDAVRSSADAEKIALMKAAEEAKAAALMAVAEERAAEKATAEAEKAAKAASAALAKRLGVSRSAYTPPDDDDDDEPGQKPSMPPAPLPDLPEDEMDLSNDVAGMHAQLDVEDALPDSALAQMTQQIQAALASAADEAKLAAAAEEHVAVLQDRIAQLEAELTVYASEHAREMRKLERRRIKGLASARVERGTALKRLREAFATRIPTETMADAAVQRALLIAGCVVKPEAVQKVDDGVHPQAYFGVVAAVHVPAPLASTVGFGADAGGNEPEPVHVLFRSTQGGELMHSATGVAVAMGTSAATGEDPDWVVKYEFDGDQSASGGEKEVTIASREGLLITRFLVDVKARPADVAKSTRYDYRSTSAAAQSVQKVVRGRSTRHLRATHAKETAAATKLQAVGRGGSSRRQIKAAAKYAQGVFLINTRKPLICRAEYDIASARVGEVAPDTRVVVLQYHTLSDGSVRAQVQKEGSTAPFGWLTATKDGASSLAPANIS